VVVSLLPCYNYFPLILYVDHLFLAFIPFFSWMHVTLSKSPAAYLIPIFCHVDKLNLAQIYLRLSAPTASTR
jgi:hypothetical protein